MQYLMGRFTVQDGARTVVRMLRRLEDQHGEKQAEQLLQTAQVYYEYGGSVAKAAEKLNLHKNTLLYRMNSCTRLWNWSRILYLCGNSLSECFWNTGICRRAVKARTAWNKKMQFVQRMNCDEFGEWISFSEKGVFVCQVYLFLA